jgi:hypothetical protein
MHNVEQIDILWTWFTEFLPYISDIRPHEPKADGGS